MLRQIALGAAFGQHLERVNVQRLGFLINVASYFYVIADVALGSSLICDIQHSLLIRHD